MALGRKRDAALALIGAWVMGSIFMAVVATQNFYLIDRLLAVGLVQGFNDVVASLGSDVAREFMRYVSSELNRLFFHCLGNCPDWYGCVTAVVGVAFRVEASPCGRVRHVHPRRGYYPRFDASDCFSGAGPRLCSARSASTRAEHLRFDSCRLFPRGHCQNGPKPPLSHSGYIETLEICLRFSAG